MAWAFTSWRSFSSLGVSWVTVLVPSLSALSLFSSDFLLLLDFSWVGVDVGDVLSNACFFLVWVSLWHTTFSCSTFVFLFFFGLTSWVENSGLVPSCGSCCSTDLAIFCLSRWSLLTSFVVGSGLFLSVPFSLLRYFPFLWAFHNCLVSFLATCYFLFCHVLIILLSFFLFRSLNANFCIFGWLRSGFNLSNFCFQALSTSWGPFSLHISLGSCPFVERFLIFFFNSLVGHLSAVSFFLAFTHSSSISNSLVFFSPAISTCSSAFPSGFAVFSGKMAWWRAD